MAAELGGGVRVAAELQLGGAAEGERERPGERRVRRHARGRHAPRAAAARADGHGGAGDCHQVSMDNLTSGLSLH